MIHTITQSFPIGSILDSLYTIDCVDVNKKMCYFLFFLFKMGLSTF